MRQISLIAVILLTVLAATQAARGDEKKARDIIARSIKAVGGEENLAKHKAITWDETGTYYGMGAGLPYTGKYAVQWPAQFRMEIENAFVIVLNKDKAWMQSNGETVELTAEQLAEQQRQHYAGWVSTLLPLKDPAFKLSLIGDIELEGKPAVGVKVQQEGKPDVDLYFDKESGLLVKSFHQVFSTELNKEVDQETFFSKYELVEGLKIPIKIRIMRDGEKFVEAESSNLKAVGTLDDDVFAKPE